MLKSAPAQTSRVGHASLAERDQIDCSAACYIPRQRHLDHPLTQEQIGTFERDGFLVCRGLLGDQVDGIRDACECVRQRSDVLQPHNLRVELIEDGRPWKIDPFHDLDPRFQALVRDRRICDALASLYQGREPRLFKDKLIMKPPGGHGSGLHQDYNWWQGFPDSLISVMIAIDAADRENGCTEFFPRHEQAFLTEPGVFGTLTHDRIDTSGHTYVETQPGDVAFFHCYTPHQAGSNNSDRWRTQIFLTYNDSRDGDHYQEHQEHYQWYITRWREEEDQNKARFV